MTDAAGPHPLVRALSIGWLMLKRPFLLRRVRRASIEWVEDVPLVTSPDVLNPVVFRSGAYFARSLAALAPAALAPAAGGLALDMGTGSGVCAIFAARLGYRVTAVDLNDEAVRCARINALLNRMEGKIDVRQGDLFEPVEGERFDLILFNPPFFRGAPRDRFDLAWRGTDVLERFAAGIPRALAPGGVALILFSSDGDTAGMLAALERADLRVTVELRRHFGSEIMTIYGARLPLTLDYLRPVTL